MERNDEARFDVYRAVTESISAAILAGADTFKMPWHGIAAIGRPENACTHMEYRGINVVALWAQAHLCNYPSGYWASYKQWQLVGGQVRHGERGSTIVFFKQVGPEAKNEIGDENPARSRLVARASRVFNAAQVDGWQPPLPKPASDPVVVQDAVTKFVEATEATITHGATGAWYDVLSDEIAMPAAERFVGSRTSTPSEAYQATLLHELVHWTGADHRLGREFPTLTLGARAREELVAEIGAAFLCADLSVSNEPRPDHAAYVASWLELLRDDPRALFVASRQATAAVNFLHELQA